ncbi:MAG: hypothetical protein WCQ16_02750 [Verrucomicrobiae bacterium]
MDPDQLGLNLRGEGFEGRLEARGVFSTAYLARHLRNAPDFASENDVATAFREIAEIWRLRLTALGRQNEAFNCSSFLEPILDRLGWIRIPQQSMPNDFATRKRPDYCLFTSESDFTAASEAGANTLFRLGATVVEAKKYGHPLDQLSNNETPGWFPSQQIQDYLNHAKDANGRRFFNWAILTNGSEWRIYTDRSTVGAYFSFHLVRSAQFCSLEEFRVFFTLFRARAFERGADGLCFLDSVREQSLRLQADLEDKLRKRIFGVLEDVGTAFVNCEENHLTETDFPEVYNNALIFLYRLLFVLYAESRGLLPVKSYGPGSNRRYLNEFSLARLVERLRDRTLYADDAFTALSEELSRLFHLINGTHARQNEALGVTRYNGGLFHPELHPRLEQWRIGDRALADVLRQLIYAQPPTRPGQRQGQLSTDEAIDYSTLEVRQLGDIYEGLLGAHFEREGARLELRNQNGENHRHGIFYTPDWVVQFLIREAVTPQLDRVEHSDDVRRALSARSEERRRDNSFALGVLRLNLVDPAMGSGHFLVRATEWLANKIMQHPTTRPMTEQVVAQGQRRVTREDIIANRRVPVPPGVSQEQSEIAYWRRRVVEACIYGVDINPMAVELAKLSLWLTCIAAEEPLNFLDHHLRQGNALLSVAPDSLRRAPAASPEGGAHTFEIGDNLNSVLADVIRETLNIEGEASTEMDVVKRKERQWRAARLQLQPFLGLADLWAAASDGLPVDEINYLLAARYKITPDELDTNERRDARRFMQSIGDGLAAKTRSLTPFHWHLEFPDVFYGEDGRGLAEAGFHAVLGNPPYISRHTMAGEPWLNAVRCMNGDAEDTYEWFTRLGFRVLRPNGAIGFVTADTFFTLESFSGMRELLQSRALDWIGQCVPFDATVDAAVFVARNVDAREEDCVTFVQARPLRKAGGTKTVPEKKLHLLPAADGIVWNEPPTGCVRHATAEELRVHSVPRGLYVDAHKRAFFEPRPGTLALFDRFNAPVKQLVSEWWTRIEDSRAFAGNLGEIRRYHRTLRPGHVTLVGLIAEGGQGMRTANNARFLAYLEGTPQAGELDKKAAEWSATWLGKASIAPTFRQFLTEAGGNPGNPVRNRAAWEAAVHRLREQFTPQQLGFGRTALFRIAPRNLIATDADYQFTWEQRKAELLGLWNSSAELAGFWEHRGLFEEKAASRLREQSDLTDEEFCRLLAGLRLWIHEENARRAARPNGRGSLLAPAISESALGLRSSEDYTDPADCPRIATIYNGLSGRGQFVAFRKGDPEGSRWVDNEPLYCEWTAAAVDWLSSSPLARWQGHKFFLTAGVTWTAVANHVAMKARYQEPCIFDADSMRLTPVPGTISAKVFLTLLNSDVLSFFKMRFIQHTQKWEIGNLRQLPIVMPTRSQHRRLEELADLCIEAKRVEFTNAAPSNELVARTRGIGEELRDNAPGYLHPGAQDFLLATPRHCLSVLGNAVNWEAEKLYGVEGLGPFDEF